MPETDKALRSGEAEPASCVFLLGVRSADVMDRLPADARIYTTALSDEAGLRAAGFQASYLYRNTETFVAASALALDWLATIRQRANAAGGPGAILFGDNKDPVWALSYDAIFEIRDGIFDCILHTVLARDLCPQDSGHVRIFATPAHSMALALQQHLGKRAAISWQDEAPASSRREARRSVGSVIRRIGSFAMHRLLLGLRRIISRPKHERAALVGISGDMSRIYRDRIGRTRHGDLYYENLEATLEDAFPDLARVGIQQRKLSGPLAVLDDWRMILLGAHSPWYGYASIGAIRALARDRRYYTAILRSAQEDARFLDLFVVDGIPFYALARARIDEMLPGTLAAANFHTAIAERFVSKENIGLVLSVESFSNLGRCLAAALHRRGGALWGIQGGIISPAMVTNTGFYAPALGGLSDLQADRFFVWGPAYRSLLTKFGIDPRKLDVIGFNRAKTLPHHSTPRSKRQILYVTGGNALVCPYLMTMEEEDYTLRSLSACIPPDSELVVRVHPRHDAEALRRSLSGRPVTVVAASEMSLDQSLAAASVVVAKASTVLLEAANAGKPVLMINLAGTPDFTGFSSGAAALPYCEDTDSLQPMLARLLDDPEQDGVLSGFAAQWCDGTAGDAAANLAAALASSSRLAS